MGQTTPGIRYEPDGVRATITIDDPDRRNPLSASVMAAMAEALGRAAADDAVRVVVITGAGDKAFSAGADLRDRFVESGPAGHRHRGALVVLLEAMRACPKPVVARVNGHALGGGLGVVAASDIAIAADHAKLGTPEVRLGLWPMMVTSVLQRLVPQKALFEMMATGRVVDAGEAARLGIVSRVVPADDLDESVDETVETLGGYSAAVLALGKESFYTAADMGAEAALDFLHVGLTAVGSTEDAAEGIAAFNEKRAPRWQGR